MARHSVLVGTAVGVLRGIVEVGLFAPLDLLTVRLRDRVIPRAVKKRAPFLSCRRYELFGVRPLCGPLMKYRYREVFAFICRQCDTGNGRCGRAT